MNTIHFDKLSMYRRDAEPISIGIPFPPGRLEEAEAFGIRNGSTAIPVQKRVTARWPDGSVKWLMTHFQADLPGNRAHDLEFFCDGSAAAASPSEHSVVVIETADGVEMDTGVLKLFCAREGSDLFDKVWLEGHDLYGRASFTGFELVDGEGREFRSGPAQRIEVLDDGPIRATVELSGTHTGNHGSLFDFRIILEVWAGKPYVRVDYQFIHREESDHVDLSRIALRFTPTVQGQAHAALGEGYYRTAVHEGDGELLLNAEKIVYQSVEHALETFYGDFWADWRDERGGVCVSLYQAHQNFPKQLSVDSDGLVVGILPESEGPLRILQGMAKTQRFQFCFHGSDWDNDEAVITSLQFQYPDVGILSEAWHRESLVWDETFPEQKYRPFERAIVDLGDKRGCGLGMLHWGDGPDHGYTNQGRGMGELVWTNNEYDFPHAMFLLFAKTGERRFRDAGCVAAQHWIDVDFCHFSDDPLKHGGQPIHTAGHVTGGVTPSHEWTEGLLDYYHLTGVREAREKAVSIADNMLRQLDSPKFSQVGGFAARETGWAMRGLIAVFVETGEARYLDACRKIADQFIEWRQRHGAFLAPYTSHTLVRVPFMIAIAVSALYRYYRVSKDDRIPEVIVEAMTDLLDHCVTPDGRFFYKELPSLHKRAGGPREMEALCYAYELSGEQRFLDQIVDMSRSVFSRHSGTQSGGKRVVRDMVGDTVLFEGASPKLFAFFYVPFMVAYKTLAEAGKLADFGPASAE